MASRRSPRRDGRRRAPCPRGAAADTSTRQRSIAYGQRLWNAQPDGGESGDGSSPRIAARARRAALPVRAPRRCAACSPAARACTDARGRAKTSPSAPHSTTAPRYITEHVVGDVAHDLQVVRDEQIGDAQLLLQVHQQVQHLRLDRHVERRHRLVGDDQLRIAASARARPRSRCRCPPENMCG